MTQKTQINCTHNNTDNWENPSVRKGNKEEQTSISNTGINIVSQISHCVVAIKLVPSLYVTNVFHNECFANNIQKMSMYQDYSTRNYQPYI